MTHRIHVLSPADLKPGTITPAGRVIEKVTLYENPSGGTLLAGIETEGGKLEALSWPLAYGWTVDGVKVEPPKGEDGG